MASEPTSVQFFIQQDHPQDPHAAVFRMRKSAAGTWEAHYWDRRTADWCAEYDIVRQYWNGFDPSISKATEEEAKAKIKQISGATAS